jgi:hypothetical protein
VKTQVTCTAIVILTIVSATLYFSPVGSELRGDRKTLVALIDTGVQVNLTEFAEYEISQVSDNPSGAHGTMVLSVLLGLTGEVKPIPPERVRVLSLDVGEGATAKNLASAIDVAVDAGAELISISMGVRRPSIELEDAMKRANEARILVVASAGNVRFLDADYPARYRNALFVSAVDSSGNYASFAGRKSVDAVALGVDVPVLRSDGRRGQESGTSLATATATVSQKIISELVAGEIDRATDHMPNSPAQRSADN